MKFKCLMILCVSYLGGYELLLISGIDGHELVSLFLRGDELGVVSPENVYGFSGIFNRRVSFDLLSLSLSQILLDS